MEKNGKIEIDLSEEQLQNITGGCTMCTYFMNQALLYSVGYASHTRAAEAARLAGNTTQAAQYTRDAQTAFGNAQKYQGLLRDKRAEHAANSAP